MPVLLRFRHVVVRSSSGAARAEPRLKKHPKSRDPRPRAAKAWRGNSAMNETVHSRSRPLTEYADDLTRFLDCPPRFLELLPVAVYACDAAGRVLWFNKRAADLWGRAPRIGDDAELFCGSHRLYFGGREIAATKRRWRGAADRRADARRGRHRRAAGRVADPRDGPYRSGEGCRRHGSSARSTASTTSRSCPGRRTRSPRASGASAQLLEALPAAIYTTDADGRIDFYNQAAVELVRPPADASAATNGASPGGSTGRTARPCRTTNARWPSR